MKKSMLVVDDDAIFRTLMRRRLESMGFAVIENASGEGVREQVLAHAPAACFIDMVMEGKEGIETVGELIELPHRPPIIAVSGNAQYLSFAEGFGIDGALLKPVTLDQLQAMLTELGIRPD